jgi:hypothetical protein
MAVTNADILGFLNANPGISDAEIVAAMEAYGVSPAQMASAVGVSEGEVAARVAATIPPNQTKLLGDTYVQPIYQTTGSGENEQVGGLENVVTYKASENKVGGDVTFYSPEGTYQQTTKQQEVNATKDFLKFAAITGAGLFGLNALGAAGTGAGSAFEALNAGAGAGADYLGGSLANVGTAGTIGNTGLTLSELTQLDMSLGGAGGTLGALTLAEQLGGLTAGTLTAGLLTSGGAPVVPTTGTPVVPSVTTVPPVVPTTTPPVVPTTVSPVVPASVTPSIAPPVVTPTSLSPLVTTAATSLIPTAVNSLLTPTNIGNLLQTGTQTAAGLLQQQTSREAAQKAQAMIDAETAAAKQSAAFRPVGMTTRFGTSQFQVDPTTGQLTSAGYTLSPEAKYAQDKLVNQANLGLQQIEQAQGQFAPLQTGAQRLFGLGNQYLAQTPQDVAQNYLNQQMALLQPGRETELANLQNRLQQQGRGGLAVAQGGAYGATTPELQALYNARAMQEAQLAAQAQQAGQQQVAFGAGLLGTGAQTMGQYYGGQQAAYAPYTTALGQAQNLETAAQQPFTMSTALAQQAAQAGANVGQLGLGGAKLSTALATSPAATTNPYSTALGGLTASPVFGQLLGGLFGSTPATTAMSALPTTFGTGTYYGNQDLGLFL